MTYYSYPTAPRRNYAKAIALAMIALAVSISVVAALLWAHQLQTQRAGTSVPASPTNSLVYTPAGQKYLDAVRSKGVPGSDGELVAAGQGVCTAVLDHGVNLEMEARSLRQQGWSGVAPAVIIVNAIQILCPPAPWMG
ncbi:DUF732 domain-containing protein [Mycobacterium sp. E3339]|uniref:DUF732 domain-containing protein n=1 Tax=Mycobacterium sp. E3339 TaxID=1834146 RepID=UPI000A48F068